MAKIKFSHRYQKMPPGFERSQLLEVLIADKNDLSEPFKNYDTFYHTGFYELPKGKLLILLLRTQSGRYANSLWTTIRRWTPEKEAYYHKMRGEIFDVVIEEDKARKEA